jgi:hypothetical protein
VIIGSALLLSGCDALDLIAKLLRIEGEAVAQQGRQIRTFSTTPGTFVLQTDTEPTIEVKDGATVYTQVEGNVTFTLLGGSDQTFTLELGDMVIERPTTGMVTLITSQ